MSDKYYEKKLSNAYSMVKSIKKGETPDYTDFMDYIMWARDCSHGETYDNDAIKYFKKFDQRVLNRIKNEFNCAIILYDMLNYTDSPFDNEYNSKELHDVEYLKLIEAMQSGIIKDINENILFNYQQAYIDHHNKSTKRRKSKRRVVKSKSKKTKRRIRSRK